VQWHIPVLIIFEMLILQLPQRQLAVGMMKMKIDIFQCVFPNAILGTKCDVSTKAAENEPPSFWAINPPAVATGFCPWL
jgi:hypothetical protein